MKHISKEEQHLIDMDDRIDSYILGKMTPEEEESFIADCKSNPELKKRALFTAMLVKSLKSK